MTFMITIMDLDLKSGIWKRFRWLLRKDLLTFFIQSWMAFLSWWNSRFQKRGLVWILMCVPSVQSSDQEKWPTVQIFDLASSWCRKLFYTRTLYFKCRVYALQSGDATGTRKQTKFVIWIVIFFRIWKFESGLFKTLGNSTVEVN